MARLQITLSEEATKEYMRIMGAVNEDHVKNDCEPSGATLQVEIDAIIDAEIMLLREKNVLLGTAHVDLIE